MKSFFSILLVSIFFVSTAFGQKMIKAVEKKFENGKPEIVAYYAGDVSPDKLAKKEVFSIDGKKVGEENYLKGKLHGTSKKWKEFDGTLIMVANYQDGLKHGEHLDYYNSGKLKNKLNYFEGEFDGLQQGWAFKDSSLRYELSYSKGIFHGQQKEYDAGGQEKYNLYFTAGKMDGIQRWWEGDSRKLREEKWTNGKMEEVLSSHTAAQPKKVVEYTFAVEKSDKMGVKGKKQPVKKIGYYESGAIAYLEYFDGESTTKEYHLSGKVKAEGKGSIDEKEGEWTWYHENGDKKSIGSFKEGKKDGHFTHYDTQGRIVLEEDWVARDNGNEEIYNRITAKATLYHGNEKKRAEGELDPKNNLLGKWTWWYDSGVKEKEADFQRLCSDVKAAPAMATMTTWSKEGVVQSEVAKDQLTEYSYFENGNKQQESVYLLRAFDLCPPRLMFYDNGKVEDNSKSLFSQKNLLKQTTYLESGENKQVDSYDRDGKREGAQMGWHDNGQKHYMYTYVKGRPEGSIKEWYADGQIMLDLNYKNYANRKWEVETGSYYTDKGKEYTYAQADGKEKKKKVVEIEVLSNFTQFRQKFE